MNFLCRLNFAYQEVTVPLYSSWPMLGMRWIFFGNCNLVVRQKFENCQVGKTACPNINLFLNYEFSLTRVSRINNLLHVENQYVDSFCEMYYLLSYLIFGDVSFGFHLKFYIKHVGPFPFGWIFNVSHKCEDHSSVVNMQKRTHPSVIFMTTSNMLDWSTSFHPPSLKSMYFSNSALIVLLWTFHW